MADAVGFELKINFINRSLAIALSDDSMYQFLHSLVIPEESA
jgi:hypothetical protein